MNDARIKALVDQGVAVDRQICELTKQQKEIKDALIAEANSRPDELQPTDGGGASLRFVGLSGCTANVAFPAPTLKSSIASGSKLLIKLQQAVHERHFAELFQKVPAWRPVEGFRERAEALLGREARRIIKLCETPTTPRVSFETKDVEED